MKPHTNSSNLDASSYDPASRIMRVRFKSGRQYDFAGVEPHHYDNMHASSSAGGYFAKHIKGGGYKATLVPEKPNVPTKEAPAA